MTATKPRKKKSESVVLTDWDMADYIKTKKDVIAHLEAALAETMFRFCYR